MNIKINHRFASCALFFFLLVLVLITLPVYAAAPDDIDGDQRAWFDAVDINANGIYTDNPANGSSITLWSDKSGLGNDISSSAATAPTYLTNNPAIQRNAIKFDGSNDYLDTLNIWSGSVSNSETFVMTTTDVKKNSFLFSSMVTNTRRISAHIPWGNGTTYFDHGTCCGSPARLFGAIPITTSLPYNWHFIGNSNLQSVVQDGDTLLSDSGVGVFIPTATSRFSLARNSVQQNTYHNGRFFEFISYQRALNNAERRILSSYLSAKWNKSFATSPTYGDVYIGDDAANGDYDYFVGGIGREVGTQSIGTSQGLTISDNNFLTADGKFVLAGVSYLTVTPITGSVTADLPSGYSGRSHRSWYIDTTGSGGTVKLSFNASTIGMPVENGQTYGLLYRPNTTGSFTEVSSAVMSGGIVSFNYLPADGIYVIGKKSPPLVLTKTSCVINDYINSAANAKRVPGATVRYMFKVSNEGVDTISNAIVEDFPASDLDATTIRNLQIQAAPCDCLAVASTSNNGANGSANGVSPVKLDFDSIASGSSAAPTVECGYFEIDIK